MRRRPNVRGWVRQTGARGAACGQRRSATRLAAGIAGLYAAVRAGCGSTGAEPPPDRHAPQHGPCARMPHSRKASKSSLTNWGRLAPVVASTWAKRVATCYCTMRYSVVCSGRCRSQWTGALSGAWCCRQMACTRLITHAQINAWIPVLVFAMLFGLSMDYEVFLVCRMREQWDGGASNEDAVAYGLAATGRLVTSAGLIMAAAFSGFLAGSIVELQQFGFALAVSVLFDVTIVRTLLLPTAMKLFGTWNWYLPDAAARILRLPHRTR